MFSQIQTSLLLLAALGIFEQVNAHGRIVSWTVTSGGETTVQPGEDYNAKDDLVTAQRRKPKGVDPPDGYLYVGDPKLGCWSSETSSGTTYAVDAGSTVTTQWSHQGDTFKPGGGNYWPDGHGGPIIECMAACPESGCDNFDAMQAEWFKISENVLYNGQWASNKIMQDGKWDIKIPSELKKGKYLLRHEILSVHGVVGTAQIYPFCIQIDLESSGTTVPKETYSIPEIYGDFSQSFLQYQIQGGEELAPIPSRPFTAPGPPVFNGAGGNGGNEGGSGGIYTGGALNVTTPTSSASAYGSSSSSSVPSQVGASSVVDASLSSTAAITNISSPVGGTIASDSPGGTGANGGNIAPTGSINMGQFAQKGKAEPSATGDAAVVMAIPSSSPGDSLADDSTPAVAPATAIAGGNDAAVSSSSSTSAAMSATTGTSEYASNIQGGRCMANTWRCQKHEDGSMYLDVCGSKTVGAGLEWVLSNDRCLYKCDDSDPSHPICE